MRHHLQRPNLVLQLQLFGNRHALHVLAAGRITAFQGEQLANLGQAETTLLRLPNETQTPNRVLVIEAVARIGFAGGNKQAFFFVITNGIGRDLGLLREFSDGMHERRRE